MLGRAANPKPSKQRVSCRPSSSKPRKGNAHAGFLPLVKIEAFLKIDLGQVEDLHSHKTAFRIRALA